MEGVRQTDRRYTCKQGGRQVKAGTRAGREKTDVKADRRLDTVHKVDRFTNVLMSIQAYIYIV